MSVAASRVPPGDPSSLLRGTAGAPRSSSLQAPGQLAGITLARQAAVLAVSIAVARLLGTGFLEHRTGDLSFTVDDRDHAVVLAVAALIAIAVRGCGRWVGRSGAAVQERARS